MGTVLVTTKSGSRYQVDLDNREVTRLSEQPLQNAPELMLQGATFYNWPTIKWGEPMAFETLHGWITTTRVADIQHFTIVLD